MADQVEKVLRRGPGYRVIGEETVVYHTKRVALTAAQIKTLHSVPVALVAAPGAAYALVFEWMTFQFTYGTVQMAAGGVVAPVYHGTTTDLTVAGGVAAATINAASNSNTLLVPLPASGGQTIRTNLGIDLLAATADFTTGDSTAVVQIGYSIITLG